MAMPRWEKVILSRPWTGETKDDEYRAAVAGMGIDFLDGYFSSFAGRFVQSSGRYTSYVDFKFNNETTTTISFSGSMRGDNLYVEVNKLVGSDNFKAIENVDFWIYKDSIVRGHNLDGDNIVPNYLPSPVIEGYEAFAPAYQPFLKELGGCYLTSSRGYGEFVGVGGKVYCNVDGLLMEV